MMLILNKGIMPDGTKIQIEDWSTEYSFMAYGKTLVAYPISKTTINEFCAPVRNESFRYEMNFENNAEALQAYNDLINGVTLLKDYSNRLPFHNANYVECV